MRFTNHVGAGVLDSPYNKSSSPQAIPSFLIPHSSLLTSKKGVDKRAKVCYSHINRFKCYDGNK